MAPRPYRRVTLKVGWFSCAQRASANTGLVRMVERGPNVILGQGDNIYVADFAAALFGSTTTAAAYNTSVANIYAHYTQAFNSPGYLAIQAWRASSSSNKYYYMLDDHEFGGDNWDWTITQAQSQNPIGGTNAGVPFQSEVDAHGWNCIQAFQQAIAAYADNPTNTDSGVAAQRPSGNAGVVVTTAASQFPPLYFRSGHYFNGTAAPAGSSGNVEIFTLCNLVHRSPIADADNGTKTMLGTTQLAWLEARLSASSATWKVINTSKKTYKSSSGDNGDTWGQYTNERNAILDYIAANNIKGVVWLTGDKHVPHVISLATSRGDAYDHVCIEASPIGVPCNTALSGTMNGITWQGARRNYGWAEFSATEAKFYHYAVEDDFEMWRGRMAVNTNYLATPTSSLRVG